MYTISSVSFQGYISTQFDQTHNKKFGPRSNLYLNCMKDCILKPLSVQFLGFDCGVTERERMTLDDSLYTLLQQYESREQTKQQQGRGKRYNSNRMVVVGGRKSMNSILLGEVDSALNLSSVSSTYQFMVHSFTPLNTNRRTPAKVHCMSYIVSIFDPLFVFHCMRLRSTLVAVESCLARSSHSAILSSDHSFYPFPVADHTYSHQRESRNIYQHINAYQYRTNVTVFCVASFSSSIFLFFSFSGLSSFHHVQEHLSIGFLVDSLFHRLKAITNLGQEGTQWSHQAYHRSRYSIISIGDYGNQCFNQLHHLSSRSKEDIGH